MEVKTSEELRTILGDLNDLREGLILKQTYLKKGIEPRNLPHSIFLEEDINHLIYVMEKLQRVLEVLIT